MPGEIGVVASNDVLNAALSQGTLFVVRLINARAKSIRWRGVKKT
jgi:hypothetical protein